VAAGALKAARRPTARATAADELFVAVAAGVGVQASRPTPPLPTASTTRSPWHPSRSRSLVRGQSRGPGDPHPVRVEPPLHPLQLQAPPPTLLTRLAVWPCITRPLSVLLPRPPPASCSPHTRPAVEAENWNFCSPTNSLVMMMNIKTARPGRDYPLLLNETAGKPPPRGGGGLAGQQEASPSFTTARLGGCRHCHWSPGAAASMPGMQCTAVEGHSPPPRVSCHPSSPAVEAEIDTSISASASASRKLMQLGVNAGERRQPTHAAAPAAAHARRQPGHAAPATAYLATYS
jgi:hypothetical protein